MKYAFADILVSRYPGFYVMAPRTPKKIKINLQIWILTPKVLIRYFPYLTCKLIYMRGYMLDWSSLIIPPNP